MRLITRANPISENRLKCIATDYKVLSEDFVKPSVTYIRKKISKDTIAQFLVIELRWTPETISMNHTPDSLSTML